MRDHEHTLEPIPDYEDHLKEAFFERAQSYFNQLTDEAHINPTENRRLVSAYREALAAQNSYEKSWRRYRLAKRLVLIGLVLSGLALGLHFLVNRTAEAAFAPGRTLVGLIVPLFLLMGLSCLYFLLLKGKIREQEAHILQYESEVAGAKALCERNMEPLNALFTSEMTLDLIRSTLPNVSFDRNFSRSRFQQMLYHYDLVEQMDAEHSTVDLLSGDIAGNPFLFIKELVHQMTTYEYEGRRTVSYTESYTDLEGNTYTRTVEEELVARVEKPGPKYLEQISLLYGHEAVANLSFSRSPQNQPAMSGKRGGLSREAIKKLHKRQKRAMKEGASFQAMANEEFEARFAAYDRSDEQAFRLLFSALGQKNMVDFLKNPVYGDDLFFTKEGRLNSIYCRHTDSWDLANDPAGYRHFDYEICRQQFLEKNQQYFQDLYFTLMPLLALPLYRQPASVCEFPGEDLPYRYNSFATEMLAQALGPLAFQPPEAETPVIYKTQSIYSKEDTDLVQVEAGAYRTEERFDVVAVQASNGSYYDVQVDWTLYIPVHATGLMEVIDLGLSEADFKQKIRRSAFSDFEQQLPCHYVYKKNFLAVTATEDQIGWSEEIRRMLRKVAEDDE